MLYLAKTILCGLMISVFVNTATFGQLLGEVLSFKCGLDRFDINGPYYGYIEASMVKLKQESIGAWMRWQQNYPSNVNIQHFKFQNIFPIPDPNNAYACSAIHYRGGCRYSRTCQTKSQCVECLNRLILQLTDTLCYLYREGSAYSKDCFARYAGKYFVDGDSHWPSLLTVF